MCVLWWIGTVLGPRSFGPFSLIGWWLAGMSAVNAGQGQQASPGFGFLDYSIIRRARDRQDETGRLLCVCSLQQKVLVPDGKDRSGAAGERKGVVGRVEVCVVSSR